ncbi:hypothetical protein ACIQVR_28990 [Streptomyces xanthochromogenes]|uniref:hypothetical protein n=1 Tax=Streptomyces xanthochromogenes TaxID=67384 RepID=UPI003812B802
MIEETDEQLLAPADFDAFFAEQAEAAERVSLTLFGREYVLPESLPLMFTLQMERVQNSSDPGDIRKMLATLYGADALDTWAEAGMTDKQLGIVLIYSAGNIRSPGSVSMQRAAELYAEQEKGKAAAPNRAARRATTKKTGKKKAGSGARS